MKNDLQRATVPPLPVPQPELTASETSGVLPKTHKIMHFRHQRDESH